MRNLTIIIADPAKDRTSSDAFEADNYEAATLEGYGGQTIIVTTRHGSHEFSRNDGRWIGGPNLNYRHWRVLPECLDAAMDSADGSRWTFRSGFAHQPSAA